MLIDLWAKQDKEHAVYGDICWCGFVGRNPPEKYVEIWNLARDARDAAVQLLKERKANNEAVMGYEVDAVARKLISEGGYADYFFHRTGHSIDVDDHGKGVNMDNYETKDSRQIVPGLLFSIEPGIYLSEFGVRTEIDVYAGENGPEIFTPEQKDLILLDV